LFLRFLNDAVLIIAMFFILKSVGKWHGHIIKHQTGMTFSAIRLMNGIGIIGPTLPVH